MSFLNQLKQQAKSLQSQQEVDLQHLEANVAATETACKTTWHYLTELPRQLNVIEPAAARLSLDGKTPWPAMKQTDFRFDARKKLLRDTEVFDYLALGWRLEPREGGVAKGSVAVNFPPDLERVERRLRVGHVLHERREQRHPDTHRIQLIVFEHELASRASVLITADHDNAVLDVRLACVNGLEIATTRYAADQWTTAVLDELAKLIVGEPSLFL